MSISKRAILGNSIAALSLCLSLASCSKIPAPTVTAASVTDALKAKGLPIGAITVFDSATDPNSLLGRPDQYTSKTSFVDTRHPLTDATETPDNTVEVFPTVESATARQEYVAAMSKNVPMFAQYIYREGLIVLRLQNEILPEQAALYEAALREIK